MYICSVKAEGPQFSPCPSLPKEVWLTQFSYLFSSPCLASLLHPLVGCKLSHPFCPILEEKHYNLSRLLHSFLEHNTQNNWKWAFVTFADHEASRLLPQVQRSLQRWSLMPSVWSCRGIMRLVHRLLLVAGILQKYRTGEAASALLFQILFEQWKANLCTSFFIS